MSKKKSAAKTKFNKLLNGLRFQEFEIIEATGKLNQNSPLEIIKQKNLGQLFALGTGKYSGYIEEKRIRKLIDKSIDAILNDNPNKMNVLTEASIIKEFDRVNQMMEKRKKANSLNWRGTNSDDAFIKKMEVFRNHIATFFASSGYGIKVLAANIANDAAFQIMQHDESLNKFLEDRRKLKESLKLQVMKLEELYLKYNSEEDINVKAKLNKEIIKLSVDIRDKGRALIIKKEFPFADKKNLDTPIMKYLLEQVVTHNIAPYIDKMEEIRTKYKRLSDKRERDDVRNIINAYIDGWFGNNFESKKAEVLQLMNNFKNLLDDFKELFPYFTLDKIISEGHSIYDTLQGMISERYTSEDIVTSFNKLKEELKSFSKKDLIKNLDNLLKLSMETL